ncbi:similar to Saccharomyces cerevisiae YCL030C HIS4 Multifunctional enzyme containing phosphoribosyl-ATP pyrophosphatase [Maudiozyma saulgeensis]|uniref:Histidine biosynthesis trifunctional protein n=1 Tax=Maudiozyma saulgeensis TaxID=1789683 RepID=A0A1X7R3G8_9SACH|nr:similar to Saccharomyces cerevisiae YCL030C HIS4 Multifunctional enzyme containing phosphoribosyl-ATP pyrophosphatase [Kazachstania saulgeensis]
MTFPIIPLYGSDFQATLTAKPFLRLVGDVALDASAFKNDTDVLNAVKQLLKGSARTVSLVLTGDKEFDENQLINLLNNGVSSLLTNTAIPFDSIPKARVLEIPSTITLTNKITLQSFTKTFLSQVKTDRKDGLYTTLVVDDKERCLGLVYSSIGSITQAISQQVGVYFSRSRNEIWVKGLTSGNTQSLLSIDIDCDADALKFTVSQVGTGFCHNGTQSCFGDLTYGLTGLEHTLNDRMINAVDGSYTQRLFKDETLLNAKIKEEAEELTEAVTKDELAWEAADLFYFAMVRLVANGVSLADVERNLGMKNLKITRRKGDAKEKFLAKDTKNNDNTQEPAAKKAKVERTLGSNDKIYLDVVNSTDLEGVTKAVTRPIQKTSQIMHLVNPIIDNVRKIGDKALMDYTKKFDGVDLKAPVLEAPFPEEYLEGLTQEMKEALDLSIENVRKFHAAQLQKKPLVVTTQPGVVCSRFPRAIEKVGIYIPGGTAILPSTALMLGVPAQVAGCKEIVFASPPRKSDGKVSPEVVYVAIKCGASKIVLAGGAQAVAAMAYGTESVPKVDKILGPGNQFVTAAKMYVQNDTQALCSIDMPAGPSEVLVIADEDADVDFVASDLLSQAEHGIDSQVILVGVNLSDKKVQHIQEAVHEQALALPRVDIVRQCIAHSTIILCDNYPEAFDMSNKYAPEHLILQINDADRYVSLVDNAGSIFVGSYTPESCGDYSSGTNHTLPTYGYARQYSGANTATFQKFITAQQVTSEGLENIGKAVMCIAKVEGLDGHRNAIKIRMSKLGLLPKDFV